MAALLTAFIAGYVLGGVGLTFFVTVRSQPRLHHLFGRKKSSKKKVNSYIVFGTQTGTAARFSRSLFAQVVNRYKALVWKVTDADDFDETVLETAQVAVFIMASYGNGEPPASAQPLYKALAESCGGDRGGSNPASPKFPDLQVAIFGLGKRRYPKFTGAAITLEQLLRQLGCSMLAPRGAGDDDGDIDTDFEAWVNDYLLPELDATYDRNDDKMALTENGAYLEKSALPAYKVSPVERKPKLHKLMSGSGRTFRSPAVADVVAVKSLLGKSTAGRNIIQVELSLAGTRLRYAAGDHLAVYPENPRNLVDAALRLLGESEDYTFRLSLPEDDDGDDGDQTMVNSALPEPPPGVLMLRSALAKYADLLSPPSKQTVLALAACATDPKEAQELRLLASPEGAEQFFKTVLQPRLGLLDLTSRYQSLEIPIGIFFGCIAPMLQPRFYSISSSPLRCGDNVQLTVGVVEEKRPEGSIYRGLCSNWLAQCEPGTIMPVYVSHSKFKLPEATTEPIVMVGPGTGIAPFIGFLQERSELKKQGMCPQKLAPLLYSCTCLTAFCSKKKIVSTCSSIDTPHRVVLFIAPLMFINRYSCPPS
jgi:NADPH-ferrihemoprotein reductase